ncbi:MAG: hypothetical protein ACI4NE_09170 [Succinivibrio sp.]
MQVNIQGKAKKIIYTMIVMMILVALSVTSAITVSKSEEAACRNTLEVSARQFSDEIEAIINVDTELLKGLSTVVAMHGELRNQHVQNIIKGFKPNALLYKIGILLPGDDLILASGTGRATSILSYEKEEPLKQHISNKSYDFYSLYTNIVRSFVPIVKNDKTLGLLYGVVNLKKISSYINTIPYDGNAYAYVVDGSSGEILIDTLHQDTVIL